MEGYRYSGTLGDVPSRFINNDNPPAARTA